MFEEKSKFILANGAFHSATTSPANVHIGRFFRFNNGFFTMETTSPMIPSLHTCGVSTASAPTFPINEEHH